MRRQRSIGVEGDPDAVAFIELMNSHLPRTFARVMRHLPSEPRCRLCKAPYGGVGGRIMRRVGFGPSRKNPALCNTCFEKAPMGGAEMDIGVLFADMRGYTELSGGMASDDVAAMLNRFYTRATDVLSRVAIIDKLVGDEVMALYLSPLLEPGWEDEMVRDARALLDVVGGDDAGARGLRLGIGIDAGRAYVGNVGSGEVKDFTAIGEVVNTASRLTSAAAPGEVVISERAYERLAAGPPDTRRVTLTLKGIAAPVDAHVLEAPQTAGAPAAAGAAA